MQSSGEVPAPPNPAVIRYISWKDVESQHLIKLRITGKKDTKIKIIRMPGHTARNYDETTEM
jgi:hypothetical protein